MDSFADITAKGVGPPSLEAQDLLAPALSGINDRAYDTLKSHFEKILGPPTSTAAGMRERNVGARGGHNHIAWDAHADLAVQLCSRCSRSVAF
jgi:hypothetical protein